LSEASVLIYEPRVEGHHVGFLKLVTEVLFDANYKLSLVIDRRPKSLQRIQKELGDLLERVTLLDACDDNGQPATGSKIATIASHRDRVGADIVFLPNFDEIASSMLRRAAFGIMPPSTLRGRLSGIYHRPQFLSIGGFSINRLLKRWGFENLLRGSWISHLLLFDSYGRAEYLKKRQAPLFDLAVPFPDDFTEDRARARRDMELPLDRRIFLFYGGAYPRKGLPLAIDAMLALPRDAPAFLLCAGESSKGPDVERKLATLVEQGRARVIDRYVSADEERSLFSASDVVLLPYRRHFAASSVLARAVGAERPVIASDEAIVGRLVRDHGLGRLAPSGDVNAWRDAMAGLIDAAPADLARWRAAARSLAPRWSRAAFRDSLIKSFNSRLNALELPATDTVAR
jgi:glycosyltransferase involved in cell wall biosynthesis